MKRVKITAFFATVAICTPFYVAIAVAPAKPGSACKKAGIFQVHKGKKFTCIKNGKKLVWGKGVKVSKAESRETSKPTSSNSPKPEDLKPGLMRADYSDYFEDDFSWFASRLPKKISYESVIDLQTMQDDYFSIQWTGYFIPNETGKWTFMSTSDDGSGVWIGKSAIDEIPQMNPAVPNPGIHAPVKVSRKIFLQKGRIYPLRIQFGDKTNWAQMTLELKSPNASNFIKNLRGLVWHSAISSQKNSGIDPSFAIKSIPTEGVSGASEVPIITPASELDPTNICKLPNPNPDLAIGRGFPVSTMRLRQSGEVRGLVLFVEFNDVKGSDDIPSRFNQFTTKFIEFFARQSYGKVTFKMDSTPRYININKNSSVYSMQTHNGGTPWLYIRDALDAADPLVDFSPYDFVVVIPPSTIKDIVYGPAFPMVSTDDYLRTNEKVLRNATVAGTDSMLAPNRSWFWLSHEVGHLFGLEHPYSWESVNYSTKRRAIWDLMETGNYAPEFLAWRRFVLGWLDEKTIRCEDINKNLGSKSVHFIAPIESQNQLPKAIILKLNESEAIVIEARRNLGFDKLSEYEEGVLAYKVNVRDIGKAQEIFVLSNEESLPGIDVTGNLMPGESIIDSGIEIKVLKSTSEGYYVEINIKKN